VGSQRLEVKRHRFLDERADFFDAVVAGDSAGKVGQIRAVRAILSFFDDDDVFHR
jgi:hypothetical protein